MCKRASLVAVLVLSVVGLLGSTACAATITYSDSFAAAAPDWTWSFAIPKYNGSETLTSVEIVLSGNVGGDMGFENRASATTITMTLTGVLTLNGPTDFGSALVVSPTVQQSELVTAYDGDTNFTGSSGRTYKNVAPATANGSKTVSGDLSDFLGAGTVLFTVDGTSQSTAAGSGKITSYFDALAGADVTVTYHTVPVPEPSVLMGLGGLGLMGLVLAWRRRRA